jgi:hypothetical protein
LPLRVVALRKVEPALTIPRFPITFADGNVALGVRLDPDIDAAAALRAMGLTTGVPTIITVGAGSRPAHVARLGPLLEKVVVTVAEAVEASVLDEAQPGGLAAALGAARRTKKAGFPLVGVAPDGAGPIELEPAHTHLVFVPGSGAGGMARWVSAVATALAGGNRSVALSVAGGDAAWESVAAHVRSDRLVMAVARTGGVADQLAAAVAGRPADRRAMALAGSGQIFAVDPAAGAASVAATLRNALSRPNALNAGPGPHSAQQ